MSTPSAHNSPWGRSCLAGVSFGGILAYEVALQLKRTGEEVAVLALLDAILPRAYTRKPVKWLKLHTERIIAEGPEYVRSRVPRMTRRVRDVMARVRQRRGEEDVLPSLDDMGGGDFVDQREMAYHYATVLYDPQVTSFPGEGVVFRARFREEFEGYAVDSLNGWSGVFDKGVTSYEVPGDHLGLLRPPYVLTTAKKLRPHLREAQLGLDRRR